MSFDDVCRIAGRLLLESEHKLSSLTASLAEARSRAEEAERQRDSLLKAIGGPVDEEKS